MRILHTSDWHLGKRLFKLDRAAEHDLFLEWLLTTLKNEAIDLLLIAGDVFDSPTPPHQALETFYNFLHRVSVETRTQTLIIAGNHDSGLLLEAPARLLAHHRVRVWGKLSPLVSDHWLELKNLSLCAIPFFRSYELLPAGEGDALMALRKYLERDKTNPQLLMLHHLAGIFEAAGSEQVIGLSGVDSIPTEILEDFDYVALGHIHKPQKVGANIYYSGSPIPLRFSETAKKSVVLIEVNAAKLTHEVLSVPVFRDLFCVKTDELNYHKDLAQLTATASLGPMVEVQIRLTAPRSGLVDELKEILRSKNMELLSYLPVFEGTQIQEHRGERLFELSPVELFREFYATKFPEAGEVPAELEKDFSELLEKVKHASAQA